MALVFALLSPSEGAEVSGKFSSQPDHSSATSKREICIYDSRYPRETQVFLDQEFIFGQTHKKAGKPGPPLWVFTPVSS